jgi:hypothetical protein
MNSKPPKRNDRYCTPMPIFSVLRENPIFISFEQTQLFRPLFRFQQILSFLNFLLFRIEIFVFNVASIKHCFCCHFVPLHEIKN